MRKILLSGLLASSVISGLPAVAATAPTTFTIKIENVSAGDTLKIPDAPAVRAPIAPGVFLVDTTAKLATSGQPASTELRSLAEDGNFEPLEKVLSAKFGDSSGMFVPGLEFSIVAKPGDMLSFATMFVQSNDKFYAPAGGAVALFGADGRPISGDLTASIRLFDAGTEVDQQPGAGADQAPRQKAPNQGADQRSVVTEASDGFLYPPVKEVIRVTIRPSN